MCLSFIIAGVPDALNNVDRVAAGLDKSPLAYFCALLFLAVVVLFFALLRIMALRVAELKESAKAAEKLGGILEQHNQTVKILEKTQEFVLSQLPRKRQPQHDEPPGLVAK